MPIRRSIKNSDEFSERKTWSLLALSVCLIAGGVFFVRGNQYHHLHVKIADHYRQYLDDWDAHYKADFAGTQWWLILEGHDQPIRLHAATSPSKAVKGSAPRAHAVTHGSPASFPTLGAGSRVRQTTLLEFRAHRLLEVVMPQQVLPERERSRLAHKLLWRPLPKELYEARAAKLRVREGAAGGAGGEGGEGGGEGGEEYEIDLGQVAFARERSVYSGGEARCAMNEGGTWEEDHTCSVMEYLRHLCYKVSKPKGSNRYVLDDSFGGPGCSPASKWEAGAWGRIGARTHKLHGRHYLPASARNVTGISVRHASDPFILERHLVDSVAPHIDTRITFHAIGLAMMFLGLVVMVPTLGFGLPALRRRGQSIMRRVRGQQPDKKSDDEREEDG